jgi:ABC-type polysaccharide/polyol phosphate export permease
VVQVRIFTRQAIDFHFLEQLLRRDFHNRYAASSLGFLWGLIEPVAFVALLWALWSHLKGADFTLLQFLAVAIGYIQWQFFSTALISSCSVYRQYSYLLTKVRVQKFLLPPVKVLAACAHFLIIKIVLLAIVVVHGHIGWQLLLIPIIDVMLIVFLLGLSYIFSILCVYFKDLQDGINVVLRFAFWCTPIIWSVGGLPPAVEAIAMVNPMYFVIGGTKYILEGGDFWVIEMAEAFTWFVIVNFSVWGAALYIYRKLASYLGEAL